MLLTRLKNDTRDLHDQIERSLGFLDGVHTADEYRTLLRKFYGYYEPVEGRLATVPWASLGFAWSDRRKTPLLERDLLASGESQRTLEALPRCRGLPPLDTVAKALGCLYVLEGSTLGGQVIVRRLRSVSGESLPSAFFGSYGGDVSAMWKAFGSFLTEYAAGRGEDDEIVQSACATFTTLGAWLTSGEGGR